MEVSIKFNICTYCLFTLWGRDVGKETKKDMEEDRNKGEGQMMNGVSGKNCPEFVSKR